jgi:CRISP-associated protein Cas1
MKTDFYLYRSGKLKRQDFSLVYIHDEAKTYLPIGQIDSLFIFGHIEINQSVISLLNEHGIPICFFTFLGNYIGKYIPNRKHIGKHVIAHAIFVSNESKRLQVARKIVMASVKNMLFILKYYHKRKRIEETIVTKFKERMISFENQPNRDTLLLFEAEMKRIYYRMFDSIILNTCFSYNVRSQYPPQNEVNAMMSFGYAILYGKIEGDIHRSRLVLELPFVHGHSKLDSGLQHDIADIFKPIYIDRLIFNLINKKAINLTHFEKRDSGVYLNRTGMGIFINHLDEYLKKTTSVNGRMYTYRQLLTKEVHNISNHIFDNKAYKPFKMTRW